MKHWWVGKIAAGVVFFLVAGLAFSYIVMLLWNALIPALFNGPVVTYFQALGLLVLSHILLRGGGPWRHRHGWRHDRWRKRWEEKLAAMTPEEREKYRAEWKGRCGWDPLPGGETSTK